MSRFDGSYAVLVGPRGEIPLPPAWWMAALAADPAGAPGPTLFIIPQDAAQGRFLVVTPDIHISRFLDRQLGQDPTATDADTFPVCLTDAGEIPGSEAFDRVPMFAPGRTIVLSGRNTGFTLAPQDD